MTPKEIRKEVQRVIEYFEPKELSQEEQEEIDEGRMDFGGASDFCKPKKSLIVDLRGRGVGDLPYMREESFPPVSSKR